MKIEILKPDDYGQLAAIADGAVPPNGSVVWVARDGPDIVGRIMVVFLPHIEAIWIREGHRRGLLAGGLVTAAHEALARSGAEKAFAFAVSAEMADYLERVGYERLPWAVLVKHIGKEAH